MAAVHPHTMAVVSTSAFHDVIGVVGLRYLIVWINYYLRERENMNTSGMTSTERVLQERAVGSKLRKYFVCTFSL